MDAPLTPTTLSLLDQLSAEHPLVAPLERGLSVDSALQQLHRQHEPAVVPRGFASLPALPSPLSAGLIPFPALPDAEVDTDDACSPGGGHGRSVFDFSDAAVARFKQPQPQPQPQPRLRPLFSVGLPGFPEPPPQLAPADSAVAAPTAGCSVVDAHWAWGRSPSQRKRSSLALLRQAGVDLTVPELGSEATMEALCELANTMETEPALWAWATQSQAERKRSSAALLKAAGVHKHCSELEAEVAMGHLATLAGEVQTSLFGGPAAPVAETSRFFEQMAVSQHRQHRHQPVSQHRQHQHQHQHQPFAGGHLQHQQQHQHHQLAFGAQHGLAPTAFGFCGFGLRRTPAMPAAPPSMSSDHRRPPSPGCGRRPAGTMSPRSKLEQLGLSGLSRRPTDHRDQLTGEWSTALTDLGTIELNAFLKQSEFSAEHCADLKKARRQRKNAVYTKRSRAKRAGRKGGGGGAHSAAASALFSG